MAFYKSKKFKYIKNLLIGIGASIVMLGALGKINAYPWGSMAITAGLTTEAIIFFILGILPPEETYYWEKLYPGLNDYHAQISPLTAGPGQGLDPNFVQNSLQEMLKELQTMSRSLASLKALQEVDFSKTKDHLKAVDDFYAKVVETMQVISETAEDTKQYREALSALNRNLAALNSVYGNVLSAFRSGLANV